MIDQNRIIELEEQWSHSKGDVAETKPDLKKLRLDTTQVFLPYTNDWTKVNIDRQ